MTQGSQASLSIAAVSADKVEGQSGSTPFTFTVTRGGNTSLATSVSWAVTGSGANPASASDFVGAVLPSGTVSFAAGETSKTITVNVAGDTVVEPNEVFTVTLSNPAASTTIGTATASGTIRSPTTTLETSGATDLDRVANKFFLHDSAGTGPSLKYAGSDVVAGQFGAWTPLGTEKIGSGYQVVWKNGSADQYILWNVDSNGNWKSAVRRGLRFGVCVAVGGGDAAAGSQPRRDNRPQNDNNRDGGRDTSGPGGQRVLPA